jgi:hypothetical protein
MSQNRTPVTYAISSSLPPFDSTRTDSTSGDCVRSSSDGFSPGASVLIVALSTMLRWCLVATEVLRTVGLTIMFAYFRKQTAVIIHIDCAASLPGAQPKHPVDGASLYKNRCMWHSSRERKTTLDCEGPSCRTTCRNLFRARYLPILNFVSDLKTFPRKSYSRN